MTAMPPFDAELLRRLDRPGPRYTSYPTAPQFVPGFGEDGFRDAARRSNADPVPRALSLYVHLPFCPSPCFYCGCNRTITRDRSRASAYLTRLVREIALVAPLFDRDRETVQLHLGGGTPNFFAPEQIAEIIESLTANFRPGRARSSDMSIELDPRCSKPEDIAALATIGFNRASMGVQDFDPKVQQAVNRMQSVAETADLVDACRRHGFRSINIDLIYGLPGQDAAGFGRTLEIVAAMRPDRLAIYGYAHLPQTFRAQRRIDATRLPDAQARIGLLSLAIDTLGEAGYRHIGMDHFALPGDDLAKALESGDLHRNFMGYTTHAESDLIGFGVSAISHVGDCYSQNLRELPPWEAAIDAGRIPTSRGLRMNADDRVRADAIGQIMCGGAIDVAAIESRHGIEFATHLADAIERLRPLADDGLVEIGPATIRATSRGRLLLRIIAACFDRYLHESAPQPARFSQAI